MRRRVLAFCLLAVLALGGVTGSATAEPAATNASVTTSLAQDSRTLTLTTHLRLTPDRPGEIEVTVRFDEPENLVELKARLSDRATVIETDGFSASDGRYVWDGETDTPSLTYRLSVNETRETTGPLAGRGDYTFVDAGPWALVRTPQIGVSWSWRGGNVTLDRQTTVEGEGVASRAMAFLGPYSEYTRLANGQQFRLIVPAAATLAPPRSAIFESVTAASDALLVGDRDASVFMIAAPTTTVEWSVRGLQTGDESFWVRDDQGLRVPDNVWIHEYVHTRQAYDATDGTRWFTEASATYYAALFSLDQGLIGFPAFSSRLEAGVVRSEDGEVLANPSTWTGRTPYLKGALVAGELDRRIRLATARRLQTVFRRMNAVGEPLTAPEFTALVADVAGPAVGRLADRYTTTDAVPSMWTRAEHLRAFEGTVARIEYALPPAAERFRVAGPYRNGSLAAGQPVELATGERLSLDVIVRNTGDATGGFDAVFTVDGRRLDYRAGSLDPGEQRRLTFSHAFDEPGTYTLAVGSLTVEVAVRNPSPPTVVSLRANASRVMAGDRVELVARLRNDAAIPAAGTLTLTRNDTTVATREVVVQPGAERPLTFVTEPPVGTHRFRLGNASATVVVAPKPTERAGAATGTAAGGPGFGVLVAVLAVIVGAVAARRGA
ncbi:MAG: hypothetical protein ABEJ94_02925 [Halorientalis sp.]